MLVKVLWSRIILSLQEAGNDAWVWWLPHSVSRRVVERDIGVSARILCDITLQTKKLQEMIQISLKVNNMLLITDHFSLIWFLIASILFLTILRQIGGDICSSTIPSALACLSRLTVPVVMFPRWLSAMFSWQSQMLVWLRSSHLDTCNCCSEIWYQAWSFPCNPDDVTYLVLTSCTIWLQIRTVT